MTEREIFAQAAKAAETKIPSIEKKIEELRLQMDELTTELNHLRMIANYGRKPSAQAPVTAPKRDGPGMQRVAEALQTKGPMSAKEIMNVIAARHNTRYGLSTIYNYLAQGRARGVFTPTPDGGRWMMANAK